MPKKIDVSDDVKLATKEDIEKIIEAVRELTKAVGDLTKENVKWYRAGKMVLPYVLTLSAIGSILIA
jgi:predicted neutral ceramidase superfamily lipid hydrolase